MSKPLTKKNKATILAGALSIVLAVAILFLTRAVGISEGISIVIAISTQIIFMALCIRVISKEKEVVAKEETVSGITAEEHDNNYTATYTTEAENTARQLGERAAEYREGIAFSRVSGVSSYRMYMNVGTSGGTPAEILWFRPGVPVSTQPPQEEVIEEKQVEQTQKVIEHMINNTDDRDIDI